jgi:hypothetical protein
MMFVPSPSAPASRLSFLEPPSTVEEDWRLTETPPLAAVSPLKSSADLGGGEEGVDYLTHPSQNNGREECKEVSREVSIPHLAFFTDFSSPSDMIGVKGPGRCLDPSPVSGTSVVHITPLVDG